MADERCFVHSFAILALPVLLAATTLPARAAAEVAPGLSLASLHQEAHDALARLASLRPLPAGTYVAFDADPVHPYVIPACDDDGDAVVAVSDAALKLLEHASYAEAQDELHGTATRASYGTLLAQSQKLGARLVPPGEWFFHGVDAQVEQTATTHFRAGLQFWIGRAASVHDAQEFRCAAPNVFRERGDLIWSLAERNVALARAARLAPERDIKRTTWALAGLFALGADERSAHTLAMLAARHPWRGPFSLPSADVIQAVSTVLRDAAPAPAPAAVPSAKPTPTLPRSLARFGRRKP